MHQNAMEQEIEPLVAATAVAAPNSPGLLRFLRGSLFSHVIFSVFAAIFPLKMMNLVAKGGRFHSFSNSLAHSNSMGGIGRRRKKDQVKATTWRQNRKIVTPTFK